MLDNSELLAKVDRVFLGMPSPNFAGSPVGAHPCQGVYVTPKGKRPKVAFVACHYNGDFTEHYMGPEMAVRGFGFLGWNTRYRGAEDMFLLENAVLDIGVGMRWLREVAGVETIVILGFSGGGSLMAAYQAEAVCPTLGDGLQGAGLDALHSLPKGDLYVSLNAHLGRPQVFTSYLDPSVVDEWDPVPTDEALNPFNPDNGPPFSQEFISRYRAAQRARNQRITDWAKEELKRLNAAGIPDRLFPVYRSWADLRFVDGSLDPSDRPTPMCYAGDPAIANRAIPGLGKVNTLKTWLSMWSLETSKCHGGVQLARFSLPSLVVQGLSDLGVFPSDARQIFDHIGSHDKELHMLPGTHYFHGNTDERKHAAELVGEWVKQKV
jgi:pimeloyl-ACP methyl ester carboxylesterase|tara:strand:- start:1629 stop:2765 length:1137 start_codon:yes stop_codon:yes gene_type:complete